MPTHFNLRVKYTDPADKRGLEVLDRLAKLAKWENAASPQKNIAGNVVKGRGCAYVKYELHVPMSAPSPRSRSTAQSAIFVSSGSTIVHDCGQIINPNGVKAQIEGTVIQTLSRTLKEEVTFDRAMVTSLDWASYPDPDLSRSARNRDRADRPTDRTAVGRRRTLERHGSCINLERHLRCHRRAPSLGAIYATEGEGSLKADLSFTTKGTVYRTATTEMRPFGHQSDFMPRRADFLVELADSNL